MLMPLSSLWNNGVGSIEVAVERYMLCRHQRTLSPNGIAGTRRPDLTVIASEAKQSSAREARKPKTVSSRNLRLDCFVAALLAMTSVASRLSKLSTGFEQAL
jgi:hypothetical protein